MASTLSLDTINQELTKKVLPPAGVCLCVVVCEREKGRRGGREGRREEGRKEGRECEREGERAK